MSDTATDVVLDVAFFRRWLNELHATVETGCDELTRLDAAIGDADHGVNMLRGLLAVSAALDESEGLSVPRDVLWLAGSRLISVVGGAAGPLYGTALRTMAERLDPVVDLENLAQAVTAGLVAIRDLGAAEPGDKTMVDAWTPAAAALAMADPSAPLAALARAERAAHAGMMSTIPMRAHKGRASYLGWRSEGHRDPGAASTWMLFSALANAAA